MDAEPQHGCFCGLKTTSGGVVRKYAGTEAEFDGEEHRIVDAEDILGVIGEV
jgi:co-chaperonin GroES (HSP10)